MIKIRVSASCSTKWFRQNVVTRESMVEVWGYWRDSRQQTPRGGQATAAVTRDSQLFVAEGLFSIQHCIDVSATEH
jgi:hypothetical protein